MYRIFDSTFKETQTIKEIMQAALDEVVTDSMADALQQKVNEFQPGQ
ncbi:MAG: hypothetical protein Q8M03_05010 [Legionella sp.]|nr:hypothetical protein [Legionella sp.]